MQEIQERQVQPLGKENLLEYEMATHSSILASKILWTEEPGGLRSTGLQRVRHDRATEHVHTVTPRLLTVSPCTFNLHSMTSALVDFTVPNTFSSVLLTPSLDHKTPKCEDLVSFIPSHRPNDSIVNICWMDKGLNGWKVPTKYE